MLQTILERINSRHLASLWGFYRDYFPNDDECLQFIYEAIHREPVLMDRMFHETDEPGIYEANDGATFHESVLFPRRMLNTVQRLVSAARDMELIRKGKDVFKLMFLITCAETLQALADPEAVKTQRKVDLVLSFFKNNTTDSDKAFISTHFSHDDEDSRNDGTKDSFEQFIAVLYEYRNCATHEGEYWDFCFNNNQDDYPILIIQNIDLVQYGKKHKLEHCFHMSISYKEFESIFVRTCIAFIRDYVSVPETTT